MTTPKGARRSPRGTMSDKPVYVGLTPVERGELEQLAAQRNRSISSMARELIRIGASHLRAIATPRSRTVGR
ncbi:MULTISPECIES: hypothetical protein [Burkholderia]|uniref:Uncharacterized protein n=1 Tax=Burkholderia lata (strain ATCC 17760 / DSM 23089 / LMG 22485 / NCIMB 9086 / R18194 / 383) TaxID=482957 RepID=A0A6P2MZW0_BURL3|nr:MULTISPECIES: hypothetical protein [Burkholderia]MBN3782938.1 hypothetical protein [Burkholderia sp. Ac-20345]VWB86083.1 hypothetical protein BLA15816_04136 [Burkholderia lata]VWB86625.1 hypothetical protein BLA14095_04027 [Burkholderia lata]VWC47661.1 hypothetical protein BLA15945_07602 [Burkholderia lata]VWD22469.1 hypothetical protein BLA18110_05522 [Burkholderia lata]